MIVLIIIAWLALGLIGSRLEYIYLKSSWTDEYYRQAYRRNDIICVLVLSICGLCNLIAGVVLYLQREKEFKIR